MRLKTRHKWDTNSDTNSKITPSEPVLTFDGNAGVYVQSGVHFKVMAFPLNIANIQLIQIIQNQWPVTRWWWPSYSIPVPQCTTTCPDWERLSTGLLYKLRLNIILYTFCSLNTQLIAFLNTIVIVKKKFCFFTKRLHKQWLKSLNQAMSQWLWK